MAFPWWAVQLAAPYLVPGERGEVYRAVQDALTPEVRDELERQARELEDAQRDFDDMTRTPGALEPYRPEKAPFPWLQTGAIIAGVGLFVVVPLAGAGIVLWMRGG